MWQVGDNVLYGAHGVCCVTAIEKQRSGREVVTYYVLSPLSKMDSKFFVPMHNELATSKIKAVLTRDELAQLLANVDKTDGIWVSDEGQRKLRYRELISSGDRAALISMILALNRHKEEQIASGRKFHLTDENFVRDAKKLLSSEISVVMQIPPESVWDYIQSNIC